MERLGKIYDYRNFLNYKNKSIEIIYVSSGKKEDGEILNLYEVNIDFCKATETFLISQFKTFEEMNEEILNWASVLIDNEVKFRDNQRKRFFAIQNNKKKADPSYRIEKYKEDYK